MNTTRPKAKKTNVSALADKRTAAMKKADPVAVELVRNSLVAATEEMKSVLMRTIIGLNRQAAGTITVLGQRMDQLSDADRTRIEARWGVLFQNGALFSSLTVAENVQAPMREHTDLQPRLMDELAALKIRLSGLPADVRAHPRHQHVLRLYRMASALPQVPAAGRLREPLGGPRAG